MNVVLTHPVHGAKVAISDAEIAHDEKQGWKRYTPDTAVKKSAKTSKPAVEQTPEIPSFLAADGTGA